MVHKQQNQHDRVRLHATGCARALFLPALPKKRHFAAGCGSRTHRRVDRAQIYGV